MISVLPWFCDRVLRLYQIGAKHQSARAWKPAARKLEQLDSVTRLDEMRIPPGNHLEVLSGKRKRQFSIRINDQFRVCFRWIDEGADTVEIVDYHKD